MKSHADWTIPRFRDIPPGYFSGTFYVIDSRRHRGYRQVCERSEKAFVAICVRSIYRMPGLFCFFESIVIVDMESLCLRFTLTVLNNGYCLVCVQNSTNT